MADQEAQELEAGVVTSMQVFDDEQHETLVGLLE